MVKETILLGIEVTGKVAEVFENNGIANVLFGFLPLCLHTAVDDVWDVEFVIPDAKIADAISALIKNGYVECTNADCDELSMEHMVSPCILKYPKHPIPIAHFHIERIPFVVALFRQSTLLLYLSHELTPERPGPDHPELMLSTDPRLPSFYDEGPHSSYYGPSGPWSGRPPVRVLNATAFTQAVLMLFMRDYPATDSDKDRVIDRFSFTWQRMARLLAGHCTPNLPEKNLPREFQLGWKYFCRKGPIEHSEFLPLMWLRKHFTEIEVFPNDLPEVNIHAFRGSKTT
ncbi:uncharacterized protein BDV14DRAFT_206327 [Aspergillus stella-maris]|uniref:uncharacterized protein n=1 Tax=Aspergillus stella-maris TaxID=1810926 RepID=UPI003CCD5588